MTVTMVFYFSLYSEVLRPAIDSPKTKNIVGALTTLLVLLIGFSSVVIGVHSYS